MSNTATTTQHTPTPWHMGNPKWFEKDGRYEIRSATCATAGKAPLAFVRGDKRVTGGDGAANAAFIVRACNSHEQLVALVRRAQEILGAYLPPDGSSEQEAITALLELFDGPESRAALAAAGA